MIDARVFICGILGGVAGALGVAGCAYQPGSFDYAIHTFPGQRATVGCFDVAIDRRADLPIGPVLGYEIANRCDHPLAVDLAALAVIGRGTDGSEVALAPYDPQHELHPIALDGRTCGNEALAYPADRGLREICVDVAPLARASGASGPGAVWRCFSAATAVARAAPVVDPPDPPRSPFPAYPGLVVVRKAP